MLYLPLLLQATATLTLDLTAPGVAVSPTLYGLMTEEINHSYDGGLYCELLRNRAFRDNPRQPDHWTALRDSDSIKLGPDHTVEVRGGLANEGYWGIPVRPSTNYRLTLWAKADGPGPIEATIESSDGKTVYAATQVSGIDGEWRKVSATLTTTFQARTTTDARLALRTGDRTVWMSMVSLFPSTYNNRPNGNRPDLIQLLVDMKPKFLRFPGGNYVEGNLFKERFDWKRTLGPIEKRPGHQAPWSYYSSDGMGLLEYLEWCEDMNAKPLLAVFAGYVLRGDVVRAGTELEGFVQDALDEIEYVTGPVSSKWGGQRARDGHPKPFPLEWVEVGNEDGFDQTGSYEDRFVQFYDAIKKKYPKIKVISTTGGKDSLGLRFPIKKRRPDLLDEHYYASTWDMMAMASKYDSYDRKGPKIFVGEWAAQDVPQPWSNPGQKGPTPNMNCALADAAFMTGMERNADLVEMSCYAPLLVNVNPGGRQWAVNLIGYDALTSFGSPSYYAQKMFMENLGDRTVALNLTGAPTQTRGDKTIPALFASATRDAKTGTLFVKVVNPLVTPLSLNISLKGANFGAHNSMALLEGDPKSMNSIAEPLKIAPTHTTVSPGGGSTFRQTVTGYSVMVLKLSTSNAAGK